MTADPTTKPARLRPSTPPSPASSAGPGLVPRARTRSLLGVALTPLLAALAACTGEAAPAADVDLDSPEVSAALESIDAEAVERHIRVLAHDSLEGRAPGTPGFAGAARYVEERLREMGLQPAGGDGTFRQPVPLRRSTVVEEESRMSVGTADGDVALR